MKRTRLYLTIAVVLVVTLVAFVRAATVTKQPVTTTDMDTTALFGLSSSATAGWQSARYSNTTNDALDVIVCVRLDMAATAAANDEAIYVYISEGVYNTNDSTWYHADAGTATLPSGSQGTYTIDSGGGNLKLIGVLKYTATGQVVQGSFRVGPTLGYNIGDGFSVIIVNYSGAAVEADGGSSDEAQVMIQPIKGDVS